MKLVLIDGNKNVLAQITEEYQAVQPERGFSEIDPEIWYDCMVNAMDRILMQCDRSRIRGIGVTGQMHGGSGCRGKAGAARHDVE